MSRQRKLDTLLRGQEFKSVSQREVEVRDRLLVYARCMAEVENVVAVLSDMRLGTSVIVAGDFGKRLGCDVKSASIDSIWEEAILSRMSTAEREEKYLAELRFFHFMRKMSANQRHRYYMASRLIFSDINGESFEVLHRMYYFSVCGDTDTVDFALCLYGPMAMQFPGRCVAVNTVNGQLTPLTAEDDSRILTSRQREVLMLIERGMTSQAIADALSISKNTVSRHRQEILAALQVRNSHEACRQAKALSLL